MIMQASSYDFDEFMAFPLICLCLCFSDLAFFSNLAFFSDLALLPNLLRGVLIIFIYKKTQLGVTKTEGFPVVFSCSVQ